MEELIDYDFPFSISLIGVDDFNDKFLILLLTQNGYKVKHLVLDAKNDNVTILNDYYTKYELSAAGSKKLNKLVEDSNVVVINDFANFEKFANLEAIVGKPGSRNKENSFPLIMNQKFEVFMPQLNCFYNIFDDKQMLSFSGILSTTRPYNEYIPPFIPREIFLKGIFIGTYINFSLYNKIQNNTTLDIINKPFLNLIYFHFNFFKYFIKNMAPDLDKGESIFSKDVYNYVKTKDGKHISMGNLEPKFQENMKGVLDKLPSSDTGVHLYEEDEIKKNGYDIDSISKIIGNQNRDELFVKFYNTESCVTPVLTLEEAVNFQKNLNKSISLNNRMKNLKKLECLKQIEKYFFTNLKNLIIVDLNPKVYTNHIPVSATGTVSIEKNSNLNAVSLEMAKEKEKEIVNPLLTNLVPKF